MLNVSLCVRLLEFHGVFGMSSMELTELKPGYSFGYLPPAFYNEKKKPESLACQENQDSTMFVFFPIGLVVVLCLRSRAFRRKSVP